MFVLGNHGLIICGNSCHAAQTLLSDVEWRLRIPPRSAPEPDLEALKPIADCSEWRLPPDRELHGLGMDALSRSILTEGILYPCQDIFLSTTDRLFLCDRDLSKLRPFLIVEGSGVLVHACISPIEYAILTGLSRVIQRIESSEAIRYLTNEEISFLAGSESQRYRLLCEHKSGPIHALSNDISRANTQVEHERRPFL